jgi:hypothetical protein
VMRAQTLQCRDDCFLLHLHRVGDHTRGLFEAEASILKSAAHPLEDVKILFFIGHCTLSFCVHSDSVQNPATCIHHEHPLLYCPPSGGCVAMSFRSGGEESVFVSS